MEREINMDEVSDGKLYDCNDLVRVGCNDCEGCSACCRGMGSSILLDPWDIWQLTENLHTTFEGLLSEGRIELNIVDGVILPDLKLAGDGESCTFLTGEGRCGIHSFRPGICRLFPLGRIYEENSFRYFLQIHECSKAGRSKMKVKKWLDIPDIRRYERFVADWHFYIKKLGAQKEEGMKERMLAMLKTFFMTPYGQAGVDLQGNFYEEFYRRLNEQNIQI